MTLPLATTRVTVKRPASGGDPTVDAAMSTVATNVRAHFSTPRGGDQVAGGTEGRIDMVLTCDPVAMLAVDRVFDENTGAVWQVAWAQERRGLGLEHTEAGVLRVTGASNG